MKCSVQSTPYPSQCDGVEQYNGRTEPIEFIECFVRDRLVKFDILPSDDAYGEKFVFSDFIGLFAKNWQKLEMGSLDYSLFVQLLEKVRVARNAMMHFRTLDIASRNSIEEMIRLLNITK